MALTLCKECGREVSDLAANCPHCGAPVVREIYCRKCGSKIPGNTKYCPVCGNSCNCITGNNADKDKIITALLALFVGYLGIHYFYLGKSTAGILTIVLTLCTCGLWDLIVFIQGIVILVMSDGEFNAKYVNTDKTFPLF